MELYPGSLFLIRPNTFTELQYYSTKFKDIIFLIMSKKTFQKLLPLSFFVGQVLRSLAPLQTVPTPRYSTELIVKL